MDDKALNDLGLSELEINSSPAITDYEIVVNPDNKVPKLALKSLNPAQAGVVAGAVFTVGAEAANVVNVAIQLNDASAVALAVKAGLNMYLSTDAAGVTIEPNGPTTIAIGTDGIFLPNGGDSVIDGFLISEADGDIDLNLTKAAADTMYMNVVLPSGLIVTSGVITFDAET